MAVENPGQPSPVFRIYLNLDLVRYLEQVRIFRDIWHKYQIPGRHDVADNLAGCVVAG